jgi:hypothetical protein
MRVSGAEPSPWRRLVPWLVVLVVLALAGGVTIWAREQDTARRAAEARADAAVERLVQAEASLTAIAHTSAAATATAQVEANQPEAALRRALDLVFLAYKEPTEARLRALSAAFGPEALSFERAEAEHLISAGTHLAGATPFELQILSSSNLGPDQTQIRTREVWTYDEVDDQGRKSRCVRDESEQTYSMKRIPGGWLVDKVELSGTTRRSDC